MLFILDLFIKTVVEGSDVFHIWNLVCDNFFLKYLLEDKGGIKAFHSRCAWRGQKCFGVFSTSPLQWISNQNYCEHGRAVFSWLLFQLGHWVVDWKEWVWFTCLKAREMVTIQRLWQKRASCKSNNCETEKKMWSTFMFAKCVLY